MSINSRGKIYQIVPKEKGAPEADRYYGSTMNNKTNQCVQVLKESISSNVIMNKTCQCCNYSTTDSSNFKKHFKTAKHLARVKTQGVELTLQEKYDALLLEHEKLKEKYALVNPVKEEDVEIIDAVTKPVILPKSFCCVACQYTTNRKYNLDLHIETERHRIKTHVPDFYDADISLVTTDLKKECIEVGSCAPILVALHFNNSYPTMRYNPIDGLEAKWSKTWLKATSLTLKNIAFGTYDEMIQKGFTSNQEKCMKYLRQRQDLNL